MDYHERVQTVVFKWYCWFARTNVALKITVKAELAALMYTENQWILSLASSSPYQYFLCCSLSTFINVNAFVLLHMKEHGFSELYDSRDILPLECLDQHRQWGLEKQIISGFGPLKELYSHVKAEQYLCYVEPADFSKGIQTRQQIQVSCFLKYSQQFWSCKLWRELPERPAASQNFTEEAKTLCQIIRWRFYKS